MHPEKLPEDVETVTNVLYLWDGIHRGRGYEAAVTIRTRRQSKRKR